MDSLISQLPQEQAIKGLAECLKEKSTEQRLEVIKTILRSNDRAVRLAGLKLTTKLIQGKHHYLPLLDMVLERKDISEIPFWLEMIGKAIGFKNIIQYFQMAVNEHPEYVVYAWYDLVPMIKYYAPDQLQSLASVGLMVENALRDQPENLKASWNRAKESLM